MQNKNKVNLTNGITHHLNERIQLLDKLLRDAIGALAGENILILSKNLLDNSPVI